MKKDQAQQQNQNQLRLEKCIKKSNTDCQEPDGIYIKSKNTIYSIKLYSKKYIQSAIECVYECWNKTQWFPEDMNLTEKQIKSSIYDRICHETLFELSHIVVNESIQKVVAVQFVDNFYNYRKNSPKWSFHPHFAPIEKVIQEFADHLGTKQIRHGLWSFWISCTIEDEVVIRQFYHQLCLKCIDQGYIMLYSFQMRSFLNYKQKAHNKKELKEKDVHLYPFIGYLNEQIRYQRQEKKKNEEEQKNVFPSIPLGHLIKEENKQPSPIKAKL